MDAGDQASPRARRAVPLISAALALIVVGSLVYLRDTAPPAPIVFPVPSSTPNLPGTYTVRYSFVTATLGWSLVSRRSPDITPFWVFKTADGAHHWQLQWKGSTRVADMSLQLFDGRNGVITFADGNAFFYRTRDGGVHWATVDLPGSVIGPTFTDPGHGWAFNSDPQRGDTFFTTADSGASWQRASPPRALVGLQSGAALRSTGEIWVGTQSLSPTVDLSVDGGTTWRAVSIRPPPDAFPTPTNIPAPKYPPPSERVYTSQVVLLPHQGVIASVSDFAGATAVFVSFDQAGSWRMLAPGPGQTAFSDFSFLDSTHWWAMKFGFLYKTSDAGQSWQEVHVAQLQENWDYGPVHVIDSRHAWSQMIETPAPVGNTALAMTADGGATWPEVNVPAPVSPPAAELSIIAAGA
ncbi:MAG TPA: hypothetical protein VJT78_01545 [Candidatus Dormibacteraeota bacterium]|nr:hypothetical protein [Candidatus Dormibacteraeota bacterium]